MRSNASSLCGVVLAFGMATAMAGCVSAIEAGHEGVMVEQPFFFGHGGVDATPTKTGRVWIAPTTKVVDVDIRPVQYAEHFDIISAENAPVSFDAFLIANVIEGKSPELISKYGPNWYANNAKEAFRTFVREEVQKYPLFLSGSASYCFGIGEENVVRKMSMVFRNSAQCVASGFV